jgi:hypothetical protein
MNPNPHHPAALGAVGKTPTGFDLFTPELGIEATALGPVILVALADDDMDNAGVGGADADHPGQVSRI